MRLRYLNEWRFSASNFRLKRTSAEEESFISKLEDGLKSRVTSMARSKRSNALFFMCEWEVVNDLMSDAMSVVKPLWAGVPV